MATNSPSAIESEAPSTAVKVARSARRNETVTPARPTAGARTSLGCGAVPCSATRAPSRIYPGEVGTGSPTKICAKKRCVQATWPQRSCKRARAASQHGDEAGVDQHAVEAARLGAVGARVEHALAT